jgi:hypothetical protein
MPVVAEALANNPDKVIPTCIVERNLVGSDVSFFKAIAFLFPFSANELTFVLFTDTIAISAAAKKALTNSSPKINKILLTVSGSSIKIPPQNLKIL